MIKFLPALISLLLVGCLDHGISFPPDIPVQKLLSTPDTIVVENRSMALSTYMWRDFQPMSSENGQFLIAIVFVTAIDTIQIPSNISADAVWIVHNNQVWKSWLSNKDAPAPEFKPNRIVKVARDGPKWGPDVYVDVIVRVTDGKGRSQLLRGSKQYIGRTD